MARSGPEVADVFRHYGDAFREQHGGSLSTEQRRAMSAIEICRTAALGGHVEQCDSCSHQRISYNSCRSRSCPKCQSLARAQWIEDRQAELLDTEYFHVVFTAPRSAFSPSFIRGGRTCLITPTCTVSFLAAACRPVASDGSPAGQASFFPSGCCRAFSAGCFCKTWRRRSWPASWPSSMPCSRSTATRLSCATCFQRERRNGSSTRSAPSAAHNKSSTMSGATPTGSRSPTTV